MSGKKGLTLRDFPEISKELVNPEEINTAAQSNRPLKWKCPRGHIYEKRVVHRINRGSGCHICKIEENSIKNLSVAKEYDDIYPIEELTRGMRKNVWWKCKEGHRYQVTIYNKVNQLSSCPQCNQRDLNHHNLLLMFPEVKQYWSDSNSLSPEHFFPFSIKKAFFVCNKGHITQRIIAKVSRDLANSKPPGCAVCDKKIVLKEDSIAVLYPALVKQLHRNNNIDPEKIAPGADKYLLWECNKGHTWYSYVFNRVKGDKISSCPECSHYHYWSDHQEELLQNIEDYIIETDEIPRMEDLSFVYYACRQNDTIPSWWDSIEAVLRRLENDVLLEELKIKRKRYEKSQ
ncbi:MAG: zinc-ribbon domain-containing protein [Candidatus Heimdallarchaeota archaeon]|nr:zinc-ribbon domain-containing protein [Candidatus Heimdallarchaeota archaeon]